MLKLDDIVTNIGDYTTDSILITLAEPLDPPGPMIVWCNRAFTEMTGWTLDEIRGKTPRILQGPDTHPETRARIGADLRAWRHISAVVRNYRKDGTPFWAELSIVPVADSSGWYRYWIGVQRDVTQRKEAELTLATRFDALRAATARLEGEQAHFEGIAAIAELSHDLLTITDTEFRIVWANPAFLRRNGFALEDVKGRAHCDLMGKRSQKYSSREVAIKAILDGAFTAGETLNTTPAGDEYWTEVRVAVQRDGAGKPCRYIMLERDITHERNLREELRAHTEQLQSMVEERTATIQSQKAAVQRALDTQKRLNAQQIQFIRMASHEFRTPMSVISMAARQLRRRTAKAGPDIAESAGEKIDLIEQSIRRLGKLIDSTLYLAKVDAGAFDFAVAPLDLERFLRERMAEWRLTAERHAILFEETCAEPPWINGDARLLDHVFDNLVGNAIKYSPEAERIEISMTTDDETVQVAVRDYGVGVPEDEQATLGERYFRASTSSGIAGTGIGLSVVRQFVDLHGGRLFIESRPGEGSTFTVAFGRIVAPNPPPDPSFAGAPARVPAPATTPAPSPVKESAP